MGLRCSLLGHDFGDAEVRQEREERGSEVLVTVREVETCARCGDERVVGENKEVTAIGDPPERPDPGAGAESAGQSSPDTGDTDGGAAADRTTGDAGAADGTVDPASEDAEIIDGGPADAGDAEPASPPAGAEADAGEPAGDPDHVPIREAEAGQTTLADAADTPDAGDDAGAAGGEATDADESSGPDPDREPGEWPEGPDRGEEPGYDAERAQWPEKESSKSPAHGEGDGEAPWPDVDEGADEGYDAEVGGEAPEDVEFGGGLTPERARGSAEAPTEASGGGADDAEFIEDTELNEQSEVTREAPPDPEEVAAAGGSADGAEGEGDESDRVIDELMEKTAEEPPAGARGADTTEGTGFSRPSSGDPDRSRPGTRRSEPLGQLESPVTEYHCPECGYTEESATSSLRAGDICPECRRGYLGERET